MFLASNEPSTDVLGPIMAFASRQMDSACSGAPSFLRGWSFLRFETTSEPGSLTTCSVARRAAPTIVVNDCYATPERLENPAIAMFWLPMALNHLCTEMIHETDEHGLFASPNWRQFRETACMHASMTWDEVVEAADRLGVDYMAETLAQALFVESGLHESLHDRAMRAGFRLSA